MFTTLVFDNFVKLNIEIRTSIYIFKIQLIKIFLNMLNFTRKLSVSSCFLEQKFPKVQFKSEYLDQFNIFDLFNIYLYYKM